MRDQEEMSQSTRPSFNVWKRLTKKPQPILHGLGSAGLVASWFLLIAPSSCILFDDEEAGWGLGEVGK